MDGRRTRCDLRSAHRRKVEGQRITARKHSCWAWLLAGDRVIPVTLVVIAKAPVAGQAKTRLAVSVGDQAAADIAAATLLDTLDVVEATPVENKVVALTGDLGKASGNRQIRSRLGDLHVVEQRGEDFSARL